MAKLVVEHVDATPLARVELDGDRFEVPRALLPDAVAIDDVLSVERSSGRVTIAIDRDATAAARRDGDALAAKLAKRDPGGNLTL